MTKKKKYWIVTDLDGTLMDENYDISPALKTIDMLKELSYPLIPCTSKTASEVREFRRIHNLLVECGKDLTYKILKSNFFNEFYLFRGSKKLTNKGKISILNINKKLKIFNNKKQENTYLDKDTLIHYY